MPTVQSDLHTHKAWSNRLQKLGLIGHFLLDSRVGGPQNYVVWLRKNLVTFNHLIFAHGSSDYLDIRLPCFRRIHKSLFAIDVILGCIRLLILEFTASTSKPHIYHIHGFDNLCPLIVAVLISKPTLWHIHECYSQFPFYRFIAYIAANSPNIRIVVTSLSSYHQLGFGAADLIPPQIDCGYWAESSKSLSRYNTEGINILSIANLNPAKGLHFLIGALAHVKHPVNLTICGSFLSSQLEYLHNLQRLISEVDGRHKVKLTGFLQPDAIKYRLENSDILVSSSDSESFPLSIVQGMCSSVHIVCTDVGDNRILLSDYPSHYITPAASEKALADAINEAIASVNRRSPFIYDISQNPHYLLGEKSRIEAIYRLLIRR